jgi:hypothetical protein
VLIAAISIGIVLLIILVGYCIERYVCERRRTVGMRIVKADHPCCHPECRKQAKWVIVYGRAPLDYTEACTKHVGELLCDAKEQSIYPIVVRQAPSKAEREAACLP